MNKDIEEKSLIVGAISNLIMALSGWYAYHLSSSQALLLDGNFSFMTFVSTLIAIKITMIKSQKSELFPFGYFVFESLYTLLKGVIIVIILVMASVNNISKVIHYLNGENVAKLDTNIILVYAIGMSILCFIVSFYYKYQNKKINYSSSILKTEAIALNLDGYMSAAIGLALVSIMFVDINGSFGFLHYIGDSILVITLVLFLIKEPFIIIRNSFIELVGGTLQNKLEKNNIEDILKKYLSKNNLLKKNYITKNGSSYIVVAYIDIKQIDILGSQEIIKLKNIIIDDLKKIQEELLFEFVLI